MRAKDLDTFLFDGLRGVQRELNSERGQEMTDRLLRKALAENPNLTVEEWTEIKRDFMVRCFWETVANTPELLDEFSEHLRNAHAADPRDDGTHNGTAADGGDQNT